MSSSNIGFTQIDVKKTQFTWKINNFRCLPYCISTGYRLESPIFNIKPDDGMKWQLYLWPNGIDSSCSAFMSISLYCASTNNGNVNVKFSVSIVNSKGKKCYDQSKDGGHLINTYSTINQFFPKNILDLEPSKILLDDVLTVHCEFSVVLKNSFTNIDDSIQQQPMDLSKKVLNAFEQQFEKQEFSDVKLVASCGKELPAHKFVLAAQSPVFCAMFTNDMAEKNDNSVTIEDIDYDSLKEMLRFMYTGRVENFGKVLDGLLLAQEKYEIDGLRELCEEYAFTTINVENVIELLALSIRYNIEKIKLLTEKFIRCHAKNVINSTAFEAIDELKLVTEIVRIVADT